MKLLAMKYFLALVLIFAPSALALPEADVHIGDAVLRAEVAHTDAARRQGLMHRRQLPENRGMLFLFPRADRYGMWMKNTRIPLDAAFIDEHGVILNIASMEPHTEVLHRAAGPAKYVLEANRGWFTERGIGPGTRVRVPGPLPAPE